MKTIRSLTVILLAGLLVACGPTKKADQGGNDPNGLGRTGQGQRGGNGGGNNPPPRVPTFAEYCGSKGGKMPTGDLCVYAYENKTIAYPDNEQGVVTISVSSVFQGMVVETKGDASGAAALYTWDNGRLAPFLPIEDKVHRGTIGAMNIGLVLIATQKYTTPAQITVWKCENPQHGVATCPF